MKRESSLFKRRTKKGTKISALADIPKIDLMLGFVMHD